MPSDALTLAVAPRATYPQVIITLQLSSPSPPAHLQPSSPEQSHPESTSLAITTYIYHHHSHHHKKKKSNCKSSPHHQQTSLSAGISTVCVLSLECSLCGSLVADILMTLMTILSQKQLICIIYNLEKKDKQKERKFKYPFWSPTLCSTICTGKSRLVVWGLGKEGEIRGPRML